MANRFLRREILKALATLPALGYFAQRFYVKYQRDFKPLSQKALDLAGKLNTSVRIPATGMSSTGDKIRVGVVG